MGVLSPFNFSVNLNIFHKIFFTKLNIRFMKFTDVRVLESAFVTGKPQAGQKPKPNKS